MLEVINKNLKLSLLILPIFAILVSGCIGPGPAVTGNGVAIQTFETDFSEVESYDRVTLFLRVQNLGEAEATSVTPQLTGINPREWGNPSFSPPSVNLDPPKPQYGTEGELQTWTVSMTAPKLPEGSSMNYKPSVRVSYAYTTSVVKTLTLVSQEELRRLVREGKTLPEGITQVSAGPLSVSVAGRVIKVRGTAFEFPLTIHVENTGGGSVYPAGRWPDLERDYDYPVGIALDLPSGVLSLPSPSECNKITINGKPATVIDLWKDRSVDLVCDVKIDNPEAISIPQVITIKLMLYYNYYIEASTSVTVKGTEAVPPSEAPPEGETLPEL